MTTTSASLAAACTASRSCAVDSTATTSTPSGSGSATLAATTVTRAPRARAVPARAYPCRPDERLPMNRTGSMGSRVPPAETTTWRPARSPGPAWMPDASVPDDARVVAAGSPSGRRSPTRASAAAAMSAGSGSRPGPVSLPVSRPDAGSRTCTPRSRSVATLARVAGWSHISVCIAGASSTGHETVSSVLVSRSSARPVAARDSRSAVAGATTSRSAPLPSATCGTCSTSSNTSGVAGWPDSASQVGRPTNSSAARVGMTRTSCPASRSRRRSRTALYAAIPPATPRTMRTGGVRPRSARWTRRSAGRR